MSVTARAMASRRKISSSGPCSPCFTMDPPTSSANDSRDQFLRPVRLAAGLQELQHGQDAAVVGGGLRQA